LGSLLASDRGTVAIEDCLLSTLAHMTVYIKSFELLSKTAGATSLEKMKNKIQDHDQLLDAQLALISILMGTLLATS
jgi:hypothetical protein